VPISLAPRFSEVVTSKRIVLQPLNGFSGEAVKTAPEDLWSTLVTSLKRGANEIATWAAIFAAVENFSRAIGQTVNVNH